MPDSFARNFDLDSLPTLPSVAMEAIRLMEGDSSTFNSLADLLKNDQVLTGKIINYANSAHVGARSEISTIPQAISAAGLNAVRSIVLSVAIFDSFSKPDKDSSENKLIHFWMHSIGVACTAEILAKQLGFQNPDEAYLAGLIHDLGKIVSYQQFPEQFAQACHEMEKQHSASDKELLPLDFEQQALGFNHIDTGKFIGERFGFPEPLIKTMWLHHQPVIEPISPDPDHLPQLVRFADVLCVTHNVGSSYFLAEEPICHDHFHFALENLIRLHHLDPADIDEIMVKVHQRVEDVCTVLGVWDKEDYQKLLRMANVSLGKMSQHLDEDNRDLFATNHILAATLDMHQKLHAGLSLSEAAEVIADTACQGFNVNRSLCLIRDPAGHRFVGAISDEHIIHEIELPTRLHDMEKRHNSTSDIEVEAANRLEQATHDLVHDRIEESRMFSMMSGSKFLATFFMADKKSRWRKEQLLGQLVIDFSSGPDYAAQGFSGLQKNFEALSSSAGTAIERYLQAKDLNRQAIKLAEASRKMEENQRQLFTAHRLATVGRLAAGAAHEINNPLTIISLNIQILKRMIGLLPDNEMLEERLGVISTQEHRISQVIQDLMGFAKPTEPKFSPENIADIIEKAILLIQGREGISNITVENHTSRDKLPKIFVDPQQIEQVFLNLLVNACQAMPKGGTLTIKATVGKNFVDILVSDTGSGIAPKDIGKIFDPFFTTKLEGEGTGLGLAVCHAIVEYNQGTMTVDSKAGKGATFKVCLPVDKSSKLRQMKQILKTKPQKPTDKAAPQRCSVLVVDDERVLNDILQETMRSAGYIAEGAYDGVEGLEKLRGTKYDVVLLDIRMPRKDGLSVLEFIKKEYPEIQVIIITGLASMAEIKETVKKGAFACLKKPFMLEKVLDTISKALKAVGKEDMMPN